MLKRRSRERRARKSARHHLLSERSTDPHGRDIISSVSFHSRCCGGCGGKLSGCGGPSARAGPDGPDTNIPTGERWLSPGEPFSGDALHSRWISIDRSFIVARPGTFSSSPYRPPGGARGRCHIAVTASAPEVEVWLGEPKLHRDLLTRKLKHFARYDRSFFCSRLMAQSVLRTSSRDRCSNITRCMFARFSSISSGVRSRACDHRARSDMCQLQARADWWRRSARAARRARTLLFATSVMSSSSLFSCVFPPQYRNMSADGTVNMIV